MCHPPHACFKNARGFFFSAITIKRHHEKAGLAFAVLSCNLRTHTYHGQFEAKDSEKGVTSSQPHLAIPRLSITTNGIQLPNMLSPQTHCGVRTRILPNHLLVFHLALDSTGFEGPSCPHPRQQSYLSCGRSTENTGPAQGRGFREHLTQRILTAVPSGCLLAGHRGLCGSHNSQLLCMAMGSVCISSDPHSDPRSLQRTPFGTMM